VASLEDHFLRLRRTIEEFQPARLIIDTLSALERIVTPRALLDFVLGLGGLLRQREITALLTAAPAGRTAGSAMPAIATEIASLADVSILLRYVEQPGRIGRVIAVLQSRGSAHDHAVRQVTIGTEGLHIGEPWPGVAHILRGAPLGPAGQPMLGTELEPDDRGLS
jgi:circadian clock protein KaiC